jgi:hypothetical protein
MAILVHKHALPLPEVAFGAALDHRIAVHVASTLTKSMGNSEFACCPFCGRVGGSCVLCLFSPRHARANKRNKLICHASLTLRVHAS